MSKTNVFTLIATILLGVLLYTISRFAANLPDAPPAESIRETATSASPGSAAIAEPAIRAAGLPIVNSYSQLLSLLTSQGVDGRSAIADSARWFEDRGYLGINTLLGVTDENARNVSLQSLDDTTLQAMLEAGDAGAGQILASRTMFIDPFAALDLYRTAAGLGSVYAILQIGSLLETLNDISLDEFVTDPEYLRKLVALRDQNSAENPKIAAFSHALAAARDGGIPVIDTEMLSWLQHLSGNLSESEQQSACEQSAQLFFEFSARRRQNGLQPISTDPPLVFLSIPDLQKQLPCRTTSYPILQLLSLESCSRTVVEDNQGGRMNLNICENQ